VYSERPGSFILRVLAISGSFSMDIFQASKALFNPPLSARFSPRVI